MYFFPSYMFSSVLLYSASAVVFEEGFKFNLISFVMYQLHSILLSKFYKKNFLLIKCDDSLLLSSSSS